MNGGSLLIRIMEWGGEAQQQGDPMEKTSMAWQTWKDQTFCQRPICGTPRKWRLNLENSNYCGRVCTQQRKILGNNTILFENLIEKEITFINAHKFKSYLTWGNNDGPTT